MRRLHSRQFPDTRKAAARRQLLDIRCDSGATRTRDPQLRRLLLYPTELRNRNLSSKRDCKDKQNSLQAASFGRRSCLEIYAGKIQNSFQSFFGDGVNGQVQHEITKGSQRANVTRNKATTAFSQNRGAASGKSAAGRTQERLAARGSERVMLPGVARKHQWSVAEPLRSASRRRFVRPAAG